MNLQTEGIGTRESVSSAFRGWSLAVKRRNVSWVRSDWDAALMWIVSAEIIRVGLSLLLVLPRLLIDTPDPVNLGTIGFFASVWIGQLSGATAAAVSLFSWLLAAIPLKGRIKGQSGQRRLLLCIRTSTLALLVTAGSALAWPEIASWSTYLGLGFVIPVCAMLAYTFANGRGVALWRLIGSWIVLVSVAAVAALTLAIGLDFGLTGALVTVAAALPSIVDLGSATLTWGFWPLKWPETSSEQLFVGPLSTASDASIPSLMPLMVLFSYIAVIVGSGYISYGARGNQCPRDYVIVSVVAASTLPGLVILGSLEVRGGSPWVSPLIASTGVALLTAIIVAAGAGEPRRARHSAGADL